MGIYTVELYLKVHLACSEGMSRREAAKHFQHIARQRGQDAVSGNQLASVTVISSSCMVADAWATALMVSGEVEGPHLAETKGISAFFISREPEGLAGYPVGDGWENVQSFQKKAPRVAFQCHYSETRTPKNKHWAKFQITVGQDIMTLP